MLNRAPATNPRGQPVSDSGSAATANATAAQSRRTPRLREYDLVILGGGSAGLSAVDIAALLGVRVALIDRERLGGECLYTGCVPSKALIHVARMVHQATAAATRVGLTMSRMEIDMKQVADSIQGVIKRVEEAEQIYTDDVTVKFGAVSFQSPTTLIVDAEKISSRATIIATGSHPAHPSIEGIDEAGYLTNEDVFQLTQLPESLLIVEIGRAHV